VGIAHLTPTNSGGQLVLRKSCPNDPVRVDNTAGIKTMAKKLWDLSLEDQRITLAVLTQLCDCLVWWTQRYKGASDLDTDE